MKQRLADYVVDFLISKNVTDCFSVVGGGAMHLNDAFGHKNINVTYNHHEQASAMAAEAYARVENKMAALCVTTGPGGTNAITGVVGAWLDSIPMFIISGQVRYDTTVRYAERYLQGENLRSIGDQEYDIVKSVEPMTKYSIMIENPNEIRYHLEKAWYYATTGRPGPVWIDIPVNFQSTYIETDELIGYNVTDNESLLPPPLSQETIMQVIQKIKKSNRPVIYAGGGIRLSGAYNIFHRVIKLLNVPVVTYWNSIDLMETTHPLYVGRGGNMGDRAGNFAIQNADLVIAIGTRLSIRQTGYNFKTWAREAEVIMINIDSVEMKKHTIHVDFPIWADAKDFLSKMEKFLENDYPLFKNNQWNQTCNEWKKNYPVVQECQKDINRKNTNVYAFVDSLSKLLPDSSMNVVSNGACCVVGHQAYVIKKDTRFIINNAIASMGYGLPAAIGACIASKKKNTICLEGDGSIMMNLQELQTIVTNNLPIKIFLINNSGYHSIRITQNNIFPNNSKVGIGPESHDLSFPEYKKIAEAFGYRYFCIKSNGEIERVVKRVLAEKTYAFCEVFTDTEQVWEPKSSTKKLEDGTLTSPPLEDLAPFLSREELKKNMFIDLLE